MQTLSIVFLFVWMVTALAFWLERQARIRIEADFRKLLGECTKLSADVANSMADISVHSVLKEQVRPLVEAGKDRDQILTAFRAEHPHIPWEHVERAMHAIVKETT